MVGSGRVPSNLLKALEEGRLHKYECRYILFHATQ